MRHRHPLTSIPATHPFHHPQDFSALISCPRAASTLLGQFPQGQPASALGTAPLPRHPAIRGPSWVPCQSHSHPTPEAHTKAEVQGFHALGSLFPSGSHGVHFFTLCSHPFYSPEHSLSGLRQMPFSLSPRTQFSGSLSPNCF